MKKILSLALVVLLVAAFMVPAAFACGDACKSAQRVTPPTSIKFDLPTEYGGSGSFYEPPTVPATEATEDTTGNTGAEQAGSTAGGTETAVANTGEKQTGSSAGGEQTAPTEAAPATEPTTPAADPAAAAAATASDSTPKTGDDSHTILWAAISLVTLGAIGVVALPLVKKTKA